MLGTIIKGGEMDRDGEEIAFLTKKLTEGELTFQQIHRFLKRSRNRWSKLWYTEWFYDSTVSPLT